jgi:hypothetical protein
MRRPRSRMRRSRSSTPRRRCAVAPRSGDPKHHVSPPYRFVEMFPCNPTEKPRENSAGDVAERLKAAVC